MSNKDPVQTADAPAAIGPYSQAIKSGSLVFLSGQIPLDPVTMELVGPGIEEQTQQVFKNLSAVAAAAGGSLNDIVKLTIFLSDLNEFATVNSIMAEHFSEPYPARATIEVSALPKGAIVEIEATMSL
ncbi:MAG: RidA family protein [Gammaproteobacteria bacterium]|nr:RidA family protein [Gammaproteobacteria bacterium]MDD9896918.1 RidA family protein [Gammaproteobacteria bacterium]